MLWVQWVTTLVSQIYESVTGTIFRAVQSSKWREISTNNRMYVLLDIHIVEGTGKVLGDFSSDKLPVLSEMYVH